MNRRNPMANCAASAALLLWSLAQAAHAQAGGDDERKREARACFARAIALADEQRLPEAIVQFQRAHELSPHFVVLYNLGRAYANLGMPVDALDAFEGYLRSGGGQISEPRRAEVRALIAQQQVRVAAIAFQIEPAGAEVFVDDRKLGSAPLEGPVRVAIGARMVRVSHPGYRSHSQLVMLASQEQRALRIRLQPAPAAAPPERGLLQVACELPDVELRLDGRVLGVTPLAAPIALPAGTHALELVRPGYESRRLSLALEPASLRSIAGECLLRPAADAATGVLEIEASEHGAKTRIDGRPPPRGGRLPSGRHIVAVRRPGFEPFTSTVSLRAGERLQVRATLQPESAFRSDYEARAETQRLWAWGLVAAGTALGAGAVALLAWNDGRHADWSREDRSLQLSAEGAGLAAVAALGQRQAANNALLNSIQRWDVITVATGVAGVLLGAAGATLWLSGDDPDRYRALALQLDGGHAVRLVAARRY